MEKKIFLIATIVMLVCIACADGNKEVIDQKTMDTVAKIAAMVEVDELQALKMLETEKMSLDKYKEVITAITLDAKMTEKFVAMKKTYIEQYQK